MDKVAAKSQSLSWQSSLLYSLFELPEHTGNAAAHPTTLSSTFKANWQPSQMTNVHLAHTELELSALCN